MMVNTTSHITIHMVASLDGFIAKRDGDVSWLQTNTSDYYQKGITLSEKDIKAFVASIDCYVMGARTYELALQLGWPYGDVPVVVFTHKTLEKNRETVSFVSGHLEDVLKSKITPYYSNIWMVGGAALTREFIRLKLADEIVMSIMPVLLGTGVPFFDAIGIEQGLHLKDVTAFKDGMVELRYQIKA